MPDYIVYLFYYRKHSVYYRDTDIETAVEMAKEKAMDVGAREFMIKAENGHRRYYRYEHGWRQYR